MILVQHPNQSQGESAKLSEVQSNILRYKRLSPIGYSYRSINALNFELRMREAIIAAAKSLNSSGATFATFSRSRGNRQYWTRLSNGGLQLKEGIAPSVAIRDIFRQGWLYAFECATAMVVILYKATLDMIGDQAFNRYFGGLVLYDWQYDSDLRLVVAAEAVPGDVVYFENPDYDPNTPEWQGENAIVLENNLYFGHGIGIASAERIISTLNSHRKPNSNRSAFLSNLIVHPDFAYIQMLGSS